MTKTYMTQEIVEYHCQTIRESITKKDFTPVDCLNWLKNNASNPVTRNDWKWIGSCLVMHGWLTVNSSNNFEVKGDVK